MLLEKELRSRARSNSPGDRGGWLVAPGSGLASTRCHRSPGRLVGAKSFNGSGKLTFLFGLWMLRASGRITGIVRAIIFLLTAVGHGMRVRLYFFIFYFFLETTVELPWQSGDIGTA